MEQSKLMSTGEVSGLSAPSQSTLHSVAETLPAVLFIDQHPRLHQRTVANQRSSDK